MPNLASLAAAFTLVYCLTLFDGREKLFRDSDSGWHIRIGERILHTTTLPHTDPFSFSRAGASWFAWEWGADLLMGSAHQMFGLRGVTLLFALALAAVSWLWVELHWAAGSTFFAIAALAPLMLSTANLHWLARPHVFGWLLALATMLWALRGVRRPWLALALGCLWANVHPSFFLGAVILGAFALGRTIDGSWTDARRYAIAGACLVAGSFLNPYGWHLHEHVVRYLADAELLRRIAEFQTFNFQLEGAFQIQLALTICTAAAVIEAGERRWAQAILLGLFAWMALRSARGLPLMAVVALPLAGASIATLLRRYWKPVAKYSENLRALDRQLSSWWMPFAIAALGVVLVRTGGEAHFPASDFPVTAARTIPSDARLFAPDKFGGYLIYESQGTRQVFFDGRSDFYGLRFMQDYIRMVEVRPGWQALFDAWGFTHALVMRDSPLRAALEARGWTKIAEDSAAVLLKGI